MTSIVGASYPIFSYSVNEFMISNDIRKGVYFRIQMCIHSFALSLRNPLHNNTFRTFRILKSANLCVQYGTLKRFIRSQYVRGCDDYNHTIINSTLHVIMSSSNSSSKNVVFFGANLTGNFVLCDHLYCMNVILRPSSL